MARFAIGQIVQLVECYGTAGPLQAGDRATVVVQGHRNEFGSYSPKVLCHKTGDEVFVREDLLSIYTNPADAPGRPQGAYNTMQALRIVLREEQPHAMEEVVRDVNRARMMAEDLRSTAFSNYPTYLSVTLLTLAIISKPGASLEPIGRRWPTHWAIEL